MYLGMLEPHKGPSTLLEAFHQSADRHGFRLEIVGEGSIRRTLIERVSELKLGDRVRVPGFLPRGEVNRLLMDTAALVVPSEWPENAPLTVLEAFAMGVPVIGSDQGGLPEILGEESGSRIFRSGNVDDLSEALTWLWKSRGEVLDRMGRKARMAYEDRFSPEKHIGRYLQIVSDRSG